MAGVLQLMLPTLLGDALTVLAAKPAFSKTIDYLRKNKAVSDWVEEGLTLHVDKEACEFCGSTLTADRINELHGHFSQDLINHKRAVTALVARTGTAALKPVKLEKNDFSPKFVEAIGVHNVEMVSLVEAYNRDLQSVLTALQDKLSPDSPPVASPDTTRVDAATV